ncbi:ubiquinol oxidase subunit II [Xylella fastidiosa subsp. multiplex]|uniref:ubiquinol oxidase subunit II n=1 Tax=Xylella fastidiosa TaxID=2371 RepID=UPI00236237AC|nr:ubiquinol oxidase subunit II [Xylella fastidiosa]MDD0926580.1 ubiquinol oxidase subunit II [Xylella fastidiosa subsp. multiplex]
MIYSKQTRQLLHLVLLLPLLLILTGCDWAVLNPKGQIGQEEKTLLIISVALMLLVVIPVIVMTVAFAWKYRASNTKARYEPEWAHSTAIEVVVWSIPCLIILVLAILTWRSSHSLDPHRPLKSDVKPITIEVVAMDWKWGMIYPEQDMATVNEIAIPINTPVNFKITSDTVMNSFFIPQLGSQIYAMAGMQTKLHLIANETGTFRGISANYSGHGFSKMNFVVHVLPDQAAFDTWVAKVKTSPLKLQQDEYQVLADDRNEKSDYPVTYYSSVEKGLFKSLIDKHMMGHGHHADDHDNHHEHQLSLEDSVSMCTSGGKQC